MSKIYNLERFLEAQERDYGTALQEIRAGRKTSHWIWYIFPQLKGLGNSYNSQYYGIDGVGEAEAYYEHPVLRERLRENTDAVLMHKGKTQIEDIMGGSLDALKLRSCMELFDKVAPNDIFQDVLVAFYGLADDGKPIVNSFKVGNRFYAGEYPGDKTPKAARLRLQHFLDRGITHFIDLTEEGELEPYAQLLPAGISYRRFPIRDVSIPKDTQSVKALIDEMDTILSNPYNKLYLHCWGGVGRTGTIVGCWYASRPGIGYATALQKTRQAFLDCPKSKHRRIPDTSDQISFIGEYSRAYGKDAMSESAYRTASCPYEYNLDKVLGCIVGGAVGDALGYPVEFLDYTAILSKFGSKGITRYKLDSDGIAEFSDDTQMTLFTATGLLAAESELNLRGIGNDESWTQHVAMHYIDWYWTQNSKPGKRHCSWLFEVPELHDRRAPGMTCMGSLRNIVQGIDQENNSKGCGGVMRVAPVALCNDLRESMSTDFMYSLGGAVADITHNNPLGFYPAAMLVMLLDKITKCGQEVNRKVLEKLVMACVREIGKVKLHDEGASDTYDKYPTAVGTLGRLMMLAVDFAGGDRPDEECIRELGGGWTGEEALAIAVYCALRHADSFEDAVVAAVNHGGDSDSTGAICGNIMGLIYGYHAIPQYFKDNLELLPVLEEVATDLYIGSARTDDLKSWKKKYLEGHRFQKVKSASWDSAAFIEEFNKWIRKPDTPENGVYPYEHVRRLRADEYKNTVQIVNAGKYITEDLKEVRLPDDSAMMTRTAFYEKSFKVTRLPAGKEETLFEVLNSDCLEAALTLLSSGYNPAVLNMASRKIPGGGVVGGAGAQEECLFRQTNLFRSLYQFVPEGRDYGVPSREEQYPLDRNYGGIYTPGATMFRESEAKGYRLMDKPIQLSFISVAAINHPALKDATHLDDSLVVGTKHKIKTILRIGLAHGHDSLVLSAFGCGAYRNPPSHMAQLFKEVFDDPEFKNKYRRVVFAIIDDHNARKAHNPEGNFKPFYDVFCDVSQC